MSVENLKKLALMCEKDPKVRKRFAAIGLKDMDGLIKYGKELHLEFSRKDVEALAKEAAASSTELSEEQLEKVAGGVVSMTAAAVIGAVVGVAALGVSAAGLAVAGAGIAVQVGSEASTNW